MGLFSLKLGIFRWKFSKKNKIFRQLKIYGVGTVATDGTGQLRKTHVFSLECMY